MIMEKKIVEYLQLSDEVEEDGGEAQRLELEEEFSREGRSFYEVFSLRGIRVNRVDPGFISCSFKVPLRLTDRDRNLANGAIANLVDEVGGALVQIQGLPPCVSVDMSIAFLSQAKLGEELEVTSRLLGERGRYKGTLVVVRNQRTGEVIAEGRHSLFGRQASKL
ncbi:PREDICTED: acyl-coenzyme A thioesterase 13-like isoform X1 [Camelina sativa]|uniref:Acyl-coenzyme A thioesterase 13-like isoform X1 n=1 Tax=Camelina sativa TaxID=90675 RepID=A0ABM0Z4T7_CAMSA|nr:PREDICTED: acyl-coenzyme A thioesterase 13-like isoform X1 [Camelina sativa]